MNSDQMGGLVRTLLAIVGGAVTQHGWVNADGWVWISGGLALFVPAVWSWYSNRPASIAASAQALTGVNVVTTGAASPAVIAAVQAAK